jgi:hypothetical protein
VQDRKEIRNELSHSHRPPVLAPARSRDVQGSTCEISQAESNRSANRSPPSQQWHETIEPAGVGLVRASAPRRVPAPLLFSTLLVLAESIDTSQGGDAGIA